MFKLTAILILNIFNVHYLFSQIAVFEADTTSIGKFILNGDNTYFNKAKEMKWKINNKIIQFFGKKVEIKVDTLSNQLDTIFYKKDNQSIWEPMFCKIQPGNFKFIYNSCCGGFKLTQKCNSISNIPIKISNLNKNKVYLGNYGIVGKVIHSEIDTLYETMESAMSSNHFKVSLCEIKICKEIDWEKTRDKINEGIYKPFCKNSIRINSDNSYDWMNKAIEYEIQKEIISFWILPFMKSKDAHFELVYDEVTKKANLKYVKYN